MMIRTSIPASMAIAIAIWSANVSAETHRFTPPTTFDNTFSFAHPPALRIANASTRISPVARLRTTQLPRR
jgi:hypothetical protein